MKSRKIVFIMTDSQRWDMVNCYRNTGLSTPSLDRMAAEGVRFERAYDAQPVCQAARAGIFTGQFPHTCCSWANCMGLADNTHTLGERLADHGVHTAYIGKWHLDGGDYFGLGRCPKGWDPAYWYDMKNYLDELSPEDRVRSRKPSTMEGEGISADFTFAHRCSNRGIDFLQKHGQEDFFLVVSYDEPHDPALCPKPYSEMYKDYCFPKSPNVYDDMANKPEHQRVWAGAQLDADKDALTIQWPGFFGCNSFADSEIGRMLDAVEQYAPDALVIYTSDHGDMACSHSLYAKGPAAYDEIIRVPLLMKGPGLKPGTVDPHPVSHLNLAPTIMELMGLPVPKVFEGISILPELEDPSVRCNEYVFTEFGRYEIDHDGFGGFQPMRAAFDGRYKLVINLLTSDELYDLETDPGELVNLINSPDHAAVRDRIHDAILDNMNRTRDPFRGYYWERRPWRTDAAPATWDYTLMTRQREEEDYEERQLDYSTGLPIVESTRKTG